MLSSETTEPFIVRLFLIMLYVKRAQFGAISLYQADEGSEPDDFSTKASVMFVRLPSGSCE